MIILTKSTQHVTPQSARLFSLRLGKLDVTVLPPLHTASTQFSGVDTKEWDWKRERKWNSLKKKSVGINCWQKQSRGKIKNVLFFFLSLDKWDHKHMCFIPFRSVTLCSYFSVLLCNTTGSPTVINGQWESPVLSYYAKQLHTYASVSAWPPVVILSLASAILFPADHSAVANTCLLINCCLGSGLGTLFYSQ